MLGIQIGFLQWMAIGVPLLLILLPLTWLLLITLYPPGKLSGDAEALIAEKRRALGAPSRGEKSVGIVFIATALAWIFRENKEFGAFTLPGIESLLPAVTDATIAMAAAVALFLIPVDAKRGEFV